MSKRIFTYLFLVSIFFLHACSFFNKKKEPETDTIYSAEELYSQAMNDMEQKEYSSAITAFDEIEGTYPYSDWSKKAQIMTAYAHYKEANYDDAVIALESYIKLHPGADDVSYAYYLRALSYYEQIITVEKDQEMTAHAQQALKEVIARFPESSYAKDAVIKLDLVKDHLAGKEMEIGRFYQQQGKYVAAINRFKEVVVHYDVTSHTAEALHRLVECYARLGVTDEARKYAAVLGHNYPGSKWYRYTYNLLGDVPKNATKKAWYTFPFIKKSIQSKDNFSSDPTTDVIETPIESR